MTSSDGGYSRKKAKKGESKDLKDIDQQVQNSQRMKMTTQNKGKDKGADEGQDKGKGRGSYGKRGEAMSVKVFTEKWGLDAGPQDLLWRMTPSKQAQVMGGFAPKDPSYDVSPLFVRWDARDWDEWL